MLRGAAVRLDEPEDQTELSVADVHVFCFEIYARDRAAADWFVNAEPEPNAVVVELDEVNAGEWRKVQRERADRVGYFWHAGTSINQERHRTGNLMGGSAPGSESGIAR